MALFVALMAVVPTLADAEDAAQAHVAVVQFANATNSSSYDAACTAATDTIVLTLTQLKRYRVQSEDQVDSGEAALRSLAEEQGFDYIVYGTMSNSESGGIDCSLSVFDRATGKTTLSQTRKAGGVLDIFDTTDELVVSVLETMTGEHIGFGSIVLKNTGEAGAYEVVLDGNMVTEESLRRVLYGRHEVVVRQKRLIGELILSQGEETVVENQATVVAFSVPYLTPEEQTLVDQKNTAIDALWNDVSAGERMDTALKDLEGLFADTSAVFRWEELKKAANERAAAWAVQEKKKAQEQAAQEQQAAPVAEKNRDEAKVRTLHMWGWVCLGTGIASLGAAAVSGIRGYSAYTSYESATDPSQITSLRDSSQTLGSVMYGTAIGGGALIISGIVMLLTHTHGDSK
jgi:TolB-like protein